MSRSTIRNYLAESHLFNRRAIMAACAVVLLVALLILRLAQLQILDHQVYTTLSEENQLTLIPIDPYRGLIYDRNGVILAESKPVYSLDIIPDHVKNFKTTLQSLRKIIDISDNDVELYHKVQKQHRPFEPVPLKLKLTEDEIAKFYLDQYKFPGVAVTARMLRYYPLGDSMVTAVGYVSRINEQETKKVDSTNYSATNYIGKTGVEKYYEDVLHGIVGYQQVETDASGRVVRVVKRIPPISGDNIYLTLDSKLQLIAEQALGDDEGAVVVIQPKTGQVLALVSNPRYDPNLFVKGISTKDYKVLQDAPSRPLYNRAIRGLYPSGSTIKPFYALQALDTKTIDTKFKIFDSGLFFLPGSVHVYKDWVYPKTKHGHGQVDLHKAIVQSCDVFFFTVGLKLGITRLDDILNRFGFGQKTGIDIEEELGGVLPSPDWKRKARGESWYTGDTVNMSIGQGYLLVTPLQLAKGVSTIANRGNVFEPRLLLKRIQADGTVINQKPVPGKTIALNDANTWNTIIDGMRGVVAEDHGTAYKFRDPPPPYTAAAKTGTAQTPRPKKYDEMENKDIPKQYLSNSLFIAFAPIDNPEIAVGIIVEHHPGQAVLVARQVIDYYLLHERWKQQGQQGSNTASGASQQQGQQGQPAQSQNASFEPMLPVPNLLKSLPHE